MIDIFNAYNSMSLEIYAAVKQLITAIKAKDINFPKFPIILFVIMLLFYFLEFTFFLSIRNGADDSIIS